MNPQNENKLLFIILLIIGLVFVYIFILPNAVIIFWILVAMVIIGILLWIINRLFIAQHPTGKGNTWFGK